MRDLNLEAWENELENDFDKTFLLHGIEFGFDIANQENLQVDILAKNHPSVLSGSQLYEKAHLQILNEIECGNYVLTESSPRIISPLGVIPKPDVGVRLIHDCSRPDGTAVNDFVGHFEKQKKTVVSLPKPDFVFFLYLCCFTLHCFIFYSATVSRITWCIQPWCVYGVKHIKC
jgi:hypothetical protein